MTPSIRIPDELKAKIQQMQAQIYLESHKKISLNTLVEKLITVAIANPAILAQILAPVPDNSKIDQWRQKYSAIPDWGISDSPKDIDEHIARH